MTNVVDLAQRRALLAEVSRLTDDAAREMTDTLVDLCFTSAERAFAVAGPLRWTEPAFAKDIYRGERRRLRKRLRAMLKPLSLPRADELIGQIVDRAYRGRLMALIDERDGVDQAVPA